MRNKILDLTKIGRSFSYFSLYCCKDFHPCHINNTFKKSSLQIQHCNLHLELMLVAFT